MKKSLILVLMCFALMARAQSDSAVVAVDTVRTDSGRVDLNLSLFSRYVWRGVQFGTGPSVQAQIAYLNGGFTAACYVAKSTYGGSTGYPNTSNIMVGYRYRSVSLFVDDYFFYDEDNLDRYLDWSDTTLHYTEARIRYDGSRCYALATYNVYAAKTANKGLYIEGGYRFPDHAISLFAGYVFDDSDLNFATSAGMTNIGITKEKKLRINDNFSLPLTGTLVVNPNYKHVVDAPGVGRNFLTLVVGVTI